jgi:aspartate carbamoyltransferase regulatory subunit
MKRELIVSAIENGTVIDHVAPGKALEVVRILNLEGFGDSVALVMNAPSGKIGRKDVVKIASRALSESEVNEIALVAPSATLSIIKNYEIVEKRKIELPDVIHGVLSCINPNCISRKEGTPRFIVEKRSPVILRCYYCERLILEDDIAGRGKG